MSLFKEDLQEEDKVYCVLNHAIKGRITKKANSHGVYLYSISVVGKKEFKGWLGVSCQNVKFLHWQLRKINITEVKKKCLKKKKQTLKKKS